MKVSGTFNIRRYWLKFNTPREVLATLYWRSGFYTTGNQGLECKYVDVNYYGDSDKDITLMELKYAEWILDRELLTYTVEGDDGLE